MPPSSCRLPARSRRSPQRLRPLGSTFSFNASERAVIAASIELRLAIRRGDPAKWSAILEQHRAAQREAFAAAPVPWQRDSGTPDLERQHCDVASILDRELRALAGMRPGSGRNDAAFRLVCRVGRWVHHSIITREQLTDDVLDACERNGLVREDGRRAVLDTIASGLAKSGGDALLELGARHG